MILLEEEPATPRFQARNTSFCRTFFLQSTTANHQAGVRRPEIMSGLLTGIHKPGIERLRLHQMLVTPEEYRAAPLPHWRNRLHQRSDANRSVPHRSDH